MTESVMSISKWFIQNNADAAVPSHRGNIKLQKLLYYSQAMNLAVNEKPLFDNTIEAWKNGPVVRDIYREYRYNQLAERAAIEDEVTESDFIATNNTARILQIINGIYGNQSSDKLIELTHKEKPWHDLKDQALRQENPVISINAIKEFYTSMLNLYEMYKDYDFESEARKFINGNFFTYDMNETSLNHDDKMQLASIGDSVRGESYFVYKEDGGLVVY